MHGLPRRYDNFPHTPSAAHSLIRLWTRRPEDKHHRWMSLGTTLWIVAEGLCRGCAQPVDAHWGRYAGTAMTSTVTAHSLWGEEMSGQLVPHVGRVVVQPTRRPIGLRTVTSTADTRAGRLANRPARRRPSTGLRPSGREATIRPPGRAATILGRTPIVRPHTDVPGRVATTGPAQTTGPGNHQAAHLPPGPRQTAWVEPRHRVDRISYMPARRGLRDRLA